MNFILNIPEKRKKKEISEVTNPPELTFIKQMIA